MVTAVENREVQVAFEVVTGAKMITNPKWLGRGMRVGGEHFKCLS
jgi:hypothetical protein